MEKYFSRLYGNEKTKSRIGAAIENATMPHAFLIGGDSGSGKTILATEIAAALNCENRGKGQALPCGECNACKRIRNHNFPDLKFLSKPKDKATLGVDAIKDFREDMFLSSTESDYKIYVIDDAECMTTEAQNALLKVLEEPPIGVIILILARECDKILTTIKSRAQYIPMARFTEKELEKYLVDISPDAKILLRDDPEKFHAIVMSSDGRLGLGINLANKKLAEECATERQEIISIVRAFCSGRSYKEIYSAVSVLPQKRNELMFCFEKIISALRDLIVIKQSEGALLTFFSTRDEAAAAGASVSVKKLLSVYDEIQKAHELCAKNANISNLVSNLAARIKLL